MKHYFLNKFARHTKLAESFTDIMRDIYADGKLMYEEGKDSWNTGKKYVKHILDERQKNTQSVKDLDTKAIPLLPVNKNERNFLHNIIYDSNGNLRSPQLSVKDNDYRHLIFNPLVGTGMDATTYNRLTDLARRDSLGHGLNKKLRSNIKDTYKIPFFSDSEHKQLPEFARRSMNIPQIGSAATIASPANNLIFVNQRLYPYDTLKSNPMFARIPEEDRNDGLTRTLGKLGDIQHKYNNMDKYLDTMDKMYPDRDDRFFNALNGFSGHEATHYSLMSPTPKVTSKAKPQATEKDTYPEVARKLAEKYPVFGGYGNHWKSLTENGLGSTITNRWNDLWNDNYFNRPLERERADRGMKTSLMSKYPFNKDEASTVNAKDFKNSIKNRALKIYDMSDAEFIRRAIKGEFTPYQLENFMRSRESYKKMTPEQREMHLEHFLPTAHNTQRQQNRFIV